MGRRSTVHKLPEAVKERIGALRQEGRTIEEILDALRELDVTPMVSRSALGRWTRQIDALGNEIRRSREVATALIERYGAAPEGRTARLNIELLHGLVTKLMVSEEGVPIEMSPQEVGALSTALRNLSTAARNDLERERRQREKFAGEAAAAAKRAGISAPTADALRDALMKQAE